MRWFSLFSIACATDVKPEVAPDPATPPASEPVASVPPATEPGPTPPPALPDFVADANAPMADCFAEELDEYGVVEATQEFDAWGWPTIEADIGGSMWLSTYERVDGKVVSSTRTRLDEHGSFVSEDVYQYDEHQHPISENDFHYTIEHDEDGRMTFLDRGIVSETFDHCERAIAGSAWTPNGVLQLAFTNTYESECLLSAVHASSFHYTYQEGRQVDLWFGDELHSTFEWSCP